MRKKTSGAGWETRKGRIIGARRLTASEKWFAIELEDGDLDHEPGQFVQVELFGIGEAPISVCSSPTRRGSFELTVRSVGRLTAAMNRLGTCDWLGIRGPFGRPFPLKLMTGNNLLLIAGGCGAAPMRSLIHFALDNRREFGQVDILLGFKTPGDILFRDEVTAWTKRLDVNLHCTVDKSEPGWRGKVGLITGLIPDIALDPERTFAAVVGPPIMYKFVIAELLKKNLPEKQIILSLERHMKCGMGRCGHCQIDHPKNYYCCKDGPVFTYEEIKDAQRL